jgi:hypothetical protein
MLARGPACTGSPPRVTTAYLVYICSLFGLFMRARRTAPMRQSARAARKLPALARAPTSAAPSVAPSSHPRRTHGLSRVLAGTSSGASTPLASGRPRRNPKRREGRVRAARMSRQRRGSPRRFVVWSSYVLHTPRTRGRCPRVVHVRRRARSSPAAVTVISACTVVRARRRSAHTHPHPSTRSAARTFSSCCPVLLRCSRRSRVLRNSCTRIWERTAALRPTLAAPACRAVPHAAHAARFGHGPFILAPRPAGPDHAHIAWWGVEFI